MHRQRQPPRESLLQRQREDTATIGPSLPPFLSEWPMEEVGYRCRRCLRSERFGKNVMLATYGDVGTRELIEILATGCPRWGNDHIYELCGISFITPWHSED